MRKVKITEEQMKYAVSEGLTVNADVNAAGGDVKKAVDTAKDSARKSGANPDKVTIQIPPNESRVITKKQIMENRFKEFKKHSDHYSLSEFLKRLGKGVNEDLTNTQIKNITGITDDDELNAAAEAEAAEDLEGEVWRSIAEIAGGNPRYKPFSFDTMTSMLGKKFNFKYQGPDDENECHNFTDGKYTLTVYPSTYYPRQGIMRIYNMHIS